MKSFLFFFLSTACCLSFPVFVHPYTQTRVLLGTTVSITIIEEQQTAQKAFASAFEEIKRIEKIMNWFDSESCVSKLNRDGANFPVEVCEDLFKIIEMSQNFSKGTDGIFDITATSLKRKDGWKNIILDKQNRTVFFKDKDVKVDLGGIAKGYAIDRAVDVLKKLDIKSALIDGGGDIRVVGKGRNGKPWNIGLMDPIDDKKILGTLSLSSSIATSGNYLREHIIDTSSGESANTDVISSSIITDNCAKAQALAKVPIIAGLSGLKYLKDVSIICVVKQHGKTYVLISEDIEFIPRKGVEVRIIR
ncbi:hypothetical protein B9J78_02485 [bacterium Unc6]|nr:hypothetical protein [bacterium Unc6]